MSKMQENLKQALVELRDSKVREYKDVVAKHQEVPDFHLAALLTLQGLHDDQRQELVESLSETELKVWKAYENKLEDGISLAITAGYTDIVKIILDDERSANIDINAHDKGGKAFLHYAVESGNIELIEFLLEKGADVNVEDRDKRTALHYAAKSGNIELIKTLLKHKADIKAMTWDGKTALHYAVQFRNISLIETLVEHEVDINAECIDGGKTALYYAVQSGNIELIKTLVEYGADINVKTWDRKTALHYAVQSENIELVEFLLEKGADINTTKDFYTETVLHIAVLCNNIELIEILLENGADINAQDRYGNTALDYALENQNRSTILSLLKQGADMRNIGYIRQDINDLLQTHIDIEEIFKHISDKKEVSEKGADILSRFYLDDLEGTNELVKQELSKELSKVSEVCKNKDATPEDKSKAIRSATISFRETLNGIEKTSTYKLAASIAKKIKSSQNITAARAEKSKHLTTPCNPEVKSNKAR